MVKAKATTKAKAKPKVKTTAKAAVKTKTKKTAAKCDKEVTLSRRAATGRRLGEDRRRKNTTVKVERRTSERRKVTRRRQIDPTTCERDYSVDEIEFMQALDRYKRSSGRMFPTCSEILEVVRALGYEKSSQPKPIPDATETDQPLSAETPESTMVSA